MRSNNRFRLLISLPPICAIPSILSNPNIDFANTSTVKPQWLFISVKEKAIITVPPTTIEKRKHTVGLEPTISCSVGKRLIQLGYACLSGFFINAICNHIGLCSDSFRILQFHLSMKNRLCSFICIYCVRVSSLSLFIVHRVLSLSCILPGARFAGWRTKSAYSRKNFWNPMEPCKAWIVCWILVECNGGADEYEEKAASFRGGGGGKA